MAKGTPTTQGQLGRATAAPSHLTTNSPPAAADSQLMPHTLLMSGLHCLLSRAEAPWSLPKLCWEKTAGREVNARLGFLALRTESSVTRTRVRGAPYALKLKQHQKGIKSWVKQQHKHVPNDCLLQTVKITGLTRAQLPLAGRKKNYKCSFNASLEQPSLTA